MTPASPAGGLPRCPAPALGATGGLGEASGHPSRRHDGPIDWAFPGHGSPGLDCGKPRKVGHLARPPEKDAGKWHIWETERTCGNADCEICFNKPDGYCDREAERIDVRVGLYFEIRNLVVVREGHHRGSVGLRRLAGSLKARAREEGRATFPNKTDAFVWSGASLYRARRLLTLAERERGGSRVRRPVHIVVSPPQDRWPEVYRADAYRKLRDEAYRQAERRGVDAGAAIFHHKRLRSERWEGNAERFKPDELDCPVDGPHWHVIGDAWLADIRECDDTGCGANGIFRFVTDVELRGYLPCGVAVVDTRDISTEPTVRVRKWHEGVDWVVTNLGIRGSVRGTAFYCLSHAAFSRLPEADGSASAGMFPSAQAEGEPQMTFSPEDGPSEYRRSNRRPVETVTWFGIYSNGHFRVPTKPAGTRRCPISGEEIDRSEVVPVRYLPFGPPPPLSESGTLVGEPDEWRDARLDCSEVSALGSRSERIRRLLEAGAWKFQTPKVPLLDRIAAEQEADRRDREDSDREEARATYAAHGPPPLRRRATRVAFATALREETDP